MRMGALILGLVLLLVVGCGCTGELKTPTTSQPTSEVQPVSETPSPSITPTENSQMANPASKYCVEQGHTTVIRENEDGSQTGYCIFPNGECEEWAFYRGECNE